MEIINALQAKKLNSQINCSSYYDFLTKKRRCLEAFTCMGMQRDYPGETVIEVPLGSAMDSAKHYDVDDNAMEWYLNTRASPVKNPLVCQCNHPLRHARQRRLKATAYPLPGRRVSPEFLSLLKQHHDRTRVHLHRKCWRPKTSFSYYKYDAEGKRRHMRPGIDTAAPLEFPNSKEMDDPEYRQRLLRGQDKVIDPPAAFRSEKELHGHYPLSPRSKRIKNRVVRHTRDKGYQDRSINAKDLKWLEVGNLGFPSEEAQGNTYLETSLAELDNKGSMQKIVETETNNNQLKINNPSVPERPHLHNSPPLPNFRDQLTKYTCPGGQMAIPLGKNKQIKDHRIFSFVKNAFYKVIQGCNDKVSLRSEVSKHSKGIQCTSDGNSVNSSRKIDVTDKKCRGILRKRTSLKTSAFDSDFRKKKKVRIASCSYASQRKSTTKNRPKINPNITGQEESRLTEGEHEKPNSSGNSPDNSERPLTHKRTSCPLNVAFQHCGTKKQEAGTNYSYFHQKRTSKCSIQKELTETNTYASKISPEATGQEESRLKEGKHEKPNSSGNSPDNRERPLTRKRISCTQMVVEPSSCNNLKTNQSKGTNPPNSRKMEKLKTYTKIHNACSEAKQRVPPKEDRNHSEFRQEKTCQCPSQKDLIETNPYGSKVNPEIKGQEKSRLAERWNEKPSFSGKSPDNSEIPLTCNGTSLTRTVVEPSNYVKTNQSKSENSPNSRKLEKPKTYTKIRNARQSSEAEQQVPPKEGHNNWVFRQKRTSKSSTQKQLTETNLYESKMNTGIMGQESRLVVRENENPNISGNSPDNSGRPFPYNRSSSTRTVAEPSSGYYSKTNQSKWDDLPKNRKVEKPKSYTELRNKCPCSEPRHQVPSKGNHNHSYFRQEKTSKSSSQKELTETNSYGKGSSSTRTVAEPSCGCHLKTNQSKKTIRESSCNRRKVKKLRVTPNLDPNHNKKRCPLKPPATKRLVNNEQLRKFGTNRPNRSKAKERNCCPEAHCNLKRWPTKPIPIRCDPITKNCVPFPHSSGNEKTDLKRWLYPRSNSGRRTKRYTKTRATRKCHESDSSSSCEQNPSRVRQQTRARSESCRRCPCCSSVFPPRCRSFQEVQCPSASRGHENNQRCCPHSKRWHCKPNCQETCEQISYAPTVSRDFTSYWRSRRMRGGVDLREDDDFIPGRNRGVPHNSSSSLSSDSDGNRQVKYTKPRKWSVHAFRFD